MLAVMSSVNIPIRWMFPICRWYHLIWPSFSSLKQILVICSFTAKSFAFKFNGNKSHCISLSKFANVDIGPMLFDTQSRAWCHSINYLGIHFLSGRGLFFLILVVLMKSFNCLLKKPIAYQFCYMLRLLFPWNLSNYRSLKFAGIPFIAKCLISSCKNQLNFLFLV